MTHLSGGAVSGIVFGCLLAFLGSISMLLWWRRVHRDLYSSDPNAWGGSWGVKAQRQLQERIDREREEQWVIDEQARAIARAEEQSKGEVWKDVEAHAGRTSNDGPTSGAVNNVQRGEAHEMDDLKAVEGGAASPAVPSAAKINPSS